MQGPFGGGLSTIKLTTTVSNLGGLGGFGAYTLSPQEIYEIDKEIKSKTDKPYNLNLWVNDHDIIDKEHTQKQYEKAVKTFKPYFELLNTEIPAPPPTFKPRFQNQLQVVFDIKPKVFSFMFGLLDEKIIEVFIDRERSYWEMQLLWTKLLLWKISELTLLLRPDLKVEVTDLHFWINLNFQQQELSF
ncbi:nitronate monooxygenase [Chryseobacterium sp. FH2]|uniref:nitronate monooxygenase n=1 Tax=Chryseobacterium sp. FH2 TaxID=1674291 RepID=UPI0021CDC707|nr:nitronate monooxygenase [Chryseobacterium sp. FH2]